jgi:hypothetical protein
MQRFVLCACALAVVVGGAGVAAQRFTPGPGADRLHEPFDQVLDTSVRDGYVYYRALKSAPGALRRYVASLDVPAATVDGWTPERQMAFWVNAYNAFVLETVIEHYPIHGTAADYPSSSIRQIPGAFDRLKHRAGGRTVTLDQIEKEILPAFKEPRLYLALGRGAVGSGRLRSEAYTAERLAGQLDAIQKEFVSDGQMLRIDRMSNRVAVTPILSWREEAFVRAYDPGPTGPFAQRSPIERALIAFTLPNLLRLEKETIQANQFKVDFQPFDWRLNDLTGGRD